MNVCARCRWAVAIEGDESGYLECHRMPVAVAGIDEDGCAVSAFPVCEPHMWCGEFKAALQSTVTMPGIEEWC